MTESPTSTRPGSAVAPPPGVESMPAQPLDAFTTAEIIAEIARRPGGTVALREAIAAADPATLTSEDHSALLDLLGRAFDAAGVE